jgi:DMSO/TMAO reductase YedYZ molybdopterin-dependent catalytic subunit
MSHDRDPSYSASGVSSVRRRLMGLGAGAGALAIGGRWIDAAFAQGAAAPSEPPGTIANDVVMKAKIAGMKMHSERPLTASAPAEFQDFDVTPTNAMFVRNNLSTPQIDAAQHVLRIVGLIERPIELTLDDLRGMQLVTTQAMLECAGSGRTGFSPAPRGTPWSVTGGMGCPKWTGVRLRDVLEKAGVRRDARHVAFSGADVGAVATAPKFIRSVPLAKAMDDYSLIAIGMNDEPLPPIHGYPMRSLIPGWVGSASIKWLNQIELRAEPFDGTYMTDSYVIPRTPVAPGEKMPPDAVSTEAWPVKSIITHPAPNAAFKVGQEIVFRGRAWAGERRIARVEVSFDEGVNWRAAALGPQGDRYAWRTFTARLRPERPGFVTCLARARDERGAAQPIASAWNPLGYFWNGIHRVGVKVEG